MATVITKNGLTRLTAPPPLDEAKQNKDKIKDEAILQILGQPLARATGKSKNKKKKKKAKKVVEEDEDDSDDDE